METARRARPHRRYASARAPSPRAQRAVVQPRVEGLWRGHGPAKAGRPSCARPSGRHASQRQTRRACVQRAGGGPAGGGRGADLCHSVRRELVVGEEQDVAGEALVRRRVGRLAHRVPRHVRRRVHRQIPQQPPAGAGVRGGVQHRDEGEHLRSGGAGTGGAPLPRNRTRVVLPLAQRSEAQGQSIAVASAGGQRGITVPVVRQRLSATDGRLSANRRPL